MEYDIFLSKNTKDLTEARRVVDLLKSYGLKVFESTQELSNIGKTDYASSIDKALENSRHIIILCSENEFGTGEGSDSLWVYYEWSSFRNEILSKRKDGNIAVVLSGGVSLSSVAFGLRKYEAFSIDEIEGDKFKNYFIIPNIKSNDGGHKTDYNPIEKKQDSSRAVNIKAFDFGLHFAMNMFANQTNNESLYDINEDYENFKDIPSYQLRTKNPDAIADIMKNAYGTEVAKFFSFGQRTGLLSIVILFQKKGANISKEQKDVFIIPFMKEGRELNIPEKILNYCINLISDKTSDIQVANFHKIIRYNILTINVEKCPYCGVENSIDNDTCKNCYAPLSL